MNHILLIDDDEATRETLADCLDSAGHTVAQAENGRKALQLLNKTSYDLIVTDVFMPELDGIELLQILGEREDQPPVISISGGGGVLPPGWATKLTEVYSVASAMTKPLDLRVFLRNVEQSLQMHN